MCGKLKVHTFANRALLGIQFATVATDKVATALSACQGHYSPNTTAN